MTNRLFIFLFFILFPVLTSADQSKNYLKDIVVTGEAFYHEASLKPGFNTLITREDIERSSAQSLFDILEKESSISIKSNTGSDKFSSIDLRGMGESASSNVLVVVDEVVLNAADMSGQGINDIDLDLIETIEIIRGSGVVLNGGGAISGVIKIKLRKVNDTKAFLNFNLGSNNKNEKDVILAHKDQVQSILLSASLDNSYGYRDNGFYNKKTFDLKYSNFQLNGFELGFNGSLLADDYGLPGPVSFSELEDEDKRKKTDFPFDEGETDKKKGMFYIKKDFKSLGKFNLSRSYQYKNNNYILGYSNLIPKKDQENQISSVSKDLKISLEKNSDHFSYIAGFDWFFDDYVRDSKVESLRKNGQLNSKDFYFASLINLDKFNFNIGFRYSKTDSKFREDLFLSGKERVGDKKDETYSNFGFESGFNYSPFKDYFQVFMIFSNSYRNPNIDELALSKGDLDSQLSQNIEAGAKFFVSDFLKGNISLFRHTTKDEIYYGLDESGGRYNRNYEDNTKRRGVDLSLDVYPLSTLYIRLTATIMEAEFEDTKNSIPLVSKNQFSSFLEYEAYKNLFIALNYSWFSKRYQGGDIEGSLSEIPAFSVLNGSVNYKKDNYKFYLKVNNILNELYATTSYENSCYPMPEREITAGIQMEF